jgi:acetyl esterase/lipase
MNPSARGGGGVGRWGGVGRAVVGLALVASLGSAAGCLALANLYRRSEAVNTAVDVPYVGRGDGVAVGDKQRLDVWAPRGAQGAPVVVFVHGGSWNSGDRRLWPHIVGLYGNVGVALADNGVVTVVPSYRLFPDVPTVEPMLDDVAAAVRWTREHIAVHGGDPERIVLAGHSAGGHLALQLLTAPGALAARGLDPAWVKGVVSISGVLDVGRGTSLAVEARRRDLWEPLFGTDVQRWSPLPRLRPDVALPPALFLIGENDYETCRRDYGDVEVQLGPVRGSRAFFARVPGNSHEDMVLEIGTVHDEVGPALAAFAHLITATPSSSPPPSPSTPPTPTP